MTKEEVLAEVEALQPVYGDDCRIIDSYPPHTVVHLKPRTADVSSQQFVEATIGILAGPEYPEEPPDITVIDSKGLDEERQKNLIIALREKSSELVSVLMLIALCEEAVERLSSMNHPDGDCPLCLYPLLDEHHSKPFMKLMSCFHCFHCDCIIKWWNWIHSQDSEKNTGSSSSSSAKNSGDKREKVGNCPVCRKIFHAKDIEHVEDLIENHSRLEYSYDEIETSKEELFESDYETTRRRRYEKILKLQQQHNGLIELKMSNVLLPGMFLQRPVSSRNDSENKFSKPDSSGSTNHDSRIRKKNSNKSNTGNQGAQRWVRKGT